MQLHPTASLFLAWMAGSSAKGLEVLNAAMNRKKRRVELGESMIDQCRAIREAFARHQSDEKLIDSVLDYHPTGVLAESDPPINGSKVRLFVLQHELRRKCLTAVLVHMASAPRAAWILHEMLRLSVNDLDQIFDGPEAASTNLTRARAYFEDTIRPRCEHVETENLCRCRSRLPNAIATGYVTYPERDDIPQEALQPQDHQFADLYRSLPPPP